MALPLINARVGQERKIIKNYNYKNAVAKDIKEWIEESDIADLVKGNAWETMKRDVCLSGMGYAPDYTEDQLECLCGDWCNASDIIGTHNGLVAELEATPTYVGPMPTYIDAFMDPMDADNYVRAQTLYMAFNDAVNRDVKADTDKELYLLCTTTAVPRDGDALTELSRRVDMADEWLAADSENFEDVANEMLEKLADKIRRDEEEA